MIKFPPEMQARIDKGCCGAHVGQGWMPLVIALDRKLAENNPDYIIHQIKEKFGGLRYYAEGVREEDCHLIEEAEELADVTCEECGKPGTLRTGGWMKTRCDACNE